MIDERKLIEIENYLEEMEKETFLTERKDNKKEAARKEQIATRDILCKKSFLAPMKLENGLRRLVRIEVGDRYSYLIRKGDMIIIAKEVIDEETLKDAVKMNIKDYKKYFLETYY